MAYSLRREPIGMWQVLYHGRKTVFGRVLILCWVVFLIAVVLLLVRPKSLGPALQPIFGPFVFLLVLTTMVCGAASLWKATRERPRTFQPKMAVGEEAAPKQPIGIRRMLVGIVVFSSFVWAFWIQKESVGYSAHTSDGVTRVSAGTSPMMLLWSVFGIVLFGILMKANVPTQLDEFQVPSMRRRFCAFLLDFWFALLTLSGIFGILPVLLEAQRTGVFQWHFERDYGTASDWVNVAAVFVFMGAILLYFALPLTRRKQTVGCWVLRLATTSPGGDVVYLPLSTALRRVIKEFMGLCSPWKTLGERDAQGRTWYDRDTGMMVIRY